MALSILSVSVLADSFVSKTAKVAKHPVHVVTWGDMADATKSALVLLSGPIDSWHSDSAWWASIGKSFSQTHRVIAIDRAGIATGNEQAPLGYVHLAKDMNTLLHKYQLSDVTLVAFASSNVSVMTYFSAYPDQQRIKRVVMIDPDVLTDFSIARYAADTKPFKDNLEKYLVYIGEGKYIPRVQQKNEIDKKTLTELAGNDTSVEWPLVELMAEHRLNIVNQQNLFKEIAMYAEELEQVKDVLWPNHIPLLLFDSAFEAAYAEKTEDLDAKKGLLDWQQDGEQYYRDLVNQSDQGQYIKLESQAHLYQFDEPEKFIELVRKFSQSL